MSALQTSHLKIHLAIPVPSTSQALARARLQSSSYTEVRQVISHLRDGVLTLDGTVSSYYLKQIAQNVVQNFEGVEQISNNLTVVYPGKND